MNPPCSIDVPEEPSGKGDEGTAVPHFSHARHHPVHSIAPLPGDEEHPLGADAIRQGLFLCLWSWRQNLDRTSDVSQIEGSMRSPGPLKTARDVSNTRIVSPRSLHLAKVPESSTFPDLVAGNPICCPVRSIVVRPKRADCRQEGYARALQAIETTQQLYRSIANPLEPLVRNGDTGPGCKRESILTSFRDPRSIGPRKSPSRHRARRVKYTVPGIPVSRSKGVL